MRRAGLDEAPSAAANSDGSWPTRAPPKRRASRCRPRPSARWPRRPAPRRTDARRERPQGGRRTGPEPTRYGDWENKGCLGFLTATATTDVGLIRYRLRLPVGATRLYLGLWSIGRDFCPHTRRPRCPLRRDLRARARRRRGDRAGDGQPQQQRRRRRPRRGSSEPTASRARRIRPRCCAWSTATRSRRGCICGPGSTSPRACGCAASTRPSSRRAAARSASRPKPRAMRFARSSIRARSASRASRSTSTAAACSPTHRRAQRRDVSAALLDAGMARPLCRRRGATSWCP